ncbi:MAG TPA: tRNA guanosine(34) transglycosylase Tgt [Thermomicrobiales bacterium]|nr:tRNA guanosine(34) transglycosylase Tgt [Thermomicrobiales bacterium]
MLMQPLDAFTVTATDGLARRGLLRLPRGVVRTPAFMPVGTQAAVKALDPADLRAVGSQIILANTYHLMLRPGADALEHLGGASHFMRWDGPLLTDSGGFQVFSLAGTRKLTANGVIFRSHSDGSQHELTPERAMKLQSQFGSDITMALDVLAGFGADDAEQAAAMRLTHEWLPRNIAAFRAESGDDPTRGLLFGICQGGFDLSRRVASAAFVAESGVDGCAIGGLSVGEPKDVMGEMLAASIDGLPADRPRYLMGVGSPEDLWNGVAAGVDLFDCVLPTRVARRGALYTPTGRVDIAASRFRLVDEPIDASCDCYTCQTFSAAYVHHLFRARELLAYRLGSIHNVRFLHRQTERMATAIEAGTFAEDRSEFISTYRPADQQIAAQQREKHRIARAHSTR